MVFGCGVLACGASGSDDDAAAGTEASSGAASSAGVGTAASATAPDTGDPSGDGTTGPVDTTADSGPTDGSSGGDTGVPSHDPNPIFADMQPGEVLDLGPFGCTPPAGEEGCIGVTDYSGMAFDPVGYRVLAFGGGHATTMNDSVIALSLDGTPSWASMHEPTPCSAMNVGNLDAGLGAWVSGTSGPYPRPVSAHTYDFVAYAPDQDEFVLLGRAFTGGYCSEAGNDIGGPIAHFDLDAGAWSFSADESTLEFSAGLAGVEHDPISRNFVSLGTAGLGIYDPAARAMVGTFDTLGGDVDITALGYANHLTYFPPTDTFYYFMRGSPVQVVALQLDRDDPAASVLTMVETTGPTPDHQEPGYDYDAAREVIGGAVLDNTFYTFDPAASLWTATAVQGGSPGTQAFHALVYDAIDDVFLFVTDYSSGGGSWAYKNG
jgi:hypothetical protein